MTKGEDVTSYVAAKDGTKIAFDIVGHGPSVVIVSGMFCDRGTTQELAEHLGRQFRVINYDRRGRGESGDSSQYAVDREVEDLDALIVEAGGVASVYGHSSGAGLALRAAAAGLPIKRLVLHEPPYGSDDEISRQRARELAENVRLAIAEDRRSDAIKLFLSGSGMPSEMVETAAGDPSMRAVAPTMPYDIEVMGESSRGGTIPEELVRAINIPTLVIAGGASPDFFRDAAARITELLPNGQHTVLDDQDHGAPAGVVAPVVADFLVSASANAR
jgi:pimeloyl-ACP methyl ester carboxylesterase